MAYMHTFVSHCIYQFEDVSFLSSCYSRPRPSSRVFVGGGCGQRSQSGLLSHVTVQVTHSEGQTEGGREGGREGNKRGQGGVNAKFQQFYA